MRDFDEIVKDKGIPWVRHWIDATFEFSNNFVKSGTTEIDFEALGREEWEFRKALKTRDFSKNERAKYLWNEAMNIHNRNANNGKKSPGRPKKSTQDDPNGNAGVDMSDAGNGAASKSPTSCDQLKEDVDIREDSQAKTDGSAITINETRAIDALEPSSNNYGEAASREGADVSTTFSMNMRQPAKTMDTSASCHYAPPSCSPEDGNLYDQEASISTDNPQPEGLTGPSHGGSVASLEASESQARKSQQRTGGSSVRGMAKVARPSVRPRASFRNKEEFIQWAIDDGLDPVDANECWESTEERGGKDADGNTVKNMKAFARQWCRTRKINRRTA